MNVTTTTPPVVKPSEDRPERVTVYVSPALSTRMRILGATTRMTLSQVIRAALADYLAARGA